LSDIADEAQRMSMILSVIFDLKDREINATKLHEAVSMKKLSREC
jgi:hypothetical protein